MCVCRQPGTPADERAGFVTCPDEGDRTRGHLGTRVLERTYTRISLWLGGLGGGPRRRGLALAGAHSESQDDSMTGYRNKSYPGGGKPRERPRLQGIKKQWPLALTTGVWHFVAQPMLSFCCVEM